MSEFTYIKFDEDIKLSDDERYYLNIIIGNKEFGVYLSDEDTNKAYKEHDNFPDCNYSLIEIITALEKLTLFLKSCMSIDIPKSLVK